MSGRVLLPVTIRLAGEAGVGGVELALVDVLDAFGLDITGAVPTPAGAFRVARARRPGSAVEADAAVERIGCAVRGVVAGAAGLGRVGRLVGEMGRHESACVRVGGLFVLNAGGTFVARTLRSCVSARRDRDDRSAHQGAFTVPRM
ncbi:hypothetical protein [Saccharothrix yanglingensis]|uniref:Uncharacterized protein n=1 Tax=Saccharothrix yanglingensis TaxID=659496 RepID=A0ABU0X119_9PSEU|nr:hypothetical protein [Saccharothrix yanglingensis]MDQ2585823.1 hypothetical protein [Saccharothrix yanglingensis]